MKAETRSKDSEINEKIDEAAKRAAKETVELLKDTGIGEAVGSKMSQILKSAQSTDTEKNERDKIIEEARKERKRLEDEMHESEVLCPTCSKGHVHVLKGTDDSKVKCTGDKCGTEYALIPTDADYACKGCHLPHKKPIEIKEKDECPFCGGSEFLKHDWSQLKKKTVMK